MPYNWWRGLYHCETLIECFVAKETDVQEWIYVLLMWKVNPMKAIL